MMRKTGGRLSWPWLDGDEQRIGKFSHAAKMQCPQLAVVDGVKSEDYAGDVMPLWQFASIITATQMNKAIPLLLAVKENTDIIPEMRDDLKATKKNTEATLDEIRGLREDIQPGYASISDRCRPMCGP